MAEKASEQLKKGRLGRGLGSLLSGAAMPSVKTIEEGNNSTVLKKQEKESLESTPASAVVDVNQQKNVASTVPPESRIWKIAVEKLHPNEFQPRHKFNKETLKELAYSIKDKGILQPIVARRHLSGALEIISGERRWRAAQIAGLQEVPVIIRTVNDQDSLELAIIENIQREDLNPIDEAEAYQRLSQEFKLTQQQVAEKVGKDRATISNSMRLLSLAETVKEMLSNHEISVGHCKVLLSIDNHKTQIDFAKQIVADQLSVRATEKNISKFHNELKKDSEIVDDPRADLKKKMIDSLIEELQKLIGTKILIDYNLGKGKLSLSFYSDEELNEITEKLRQSWKK